MGKRGAKSKTNKHQQDINQLIARVSDDDPEFRAFSIVIPSREEMIEENFTLSEFHAGKSIITWCCENLHQLFPNKMDAGVKGMEWVHAWNNLYQDKILENGVYFFLYSKEDQERFIELMLNDIKWSKTSERYKKWKYALHIRERKPKLSSNEGESCREERERKTREEVNELFRTKVIQFFSERPQIILQRNDGPCPLLAICNVILLRNDFKLSEDVTEIPQDLLLSYVHDELIKSNNNNKDAKITDAINFLHQLATGMLVNIKFNGITEIESTMGHEVFDLLDIPLYHGWIIDPQDTATCNAIGSKSFDTIMGELTEEIEDKKRPEKDPVDDSIGSVSKHKKAGKGDLEEEVDVLRAMIISGNDSKKLSESRIEYTPQELIKDFLDNNAIQLTMHGLTCLQDQVEENKLCVTALKSGVGI